MKNLKIFYFTLFLILLIFSQCNSDVNYPVSFTLEINGVEKKVENAEVIIKTINGQGFPGQITGRVDNGYISILFSGDLDDEFFIISITLYKNGYNDSYTCLGCDFDLSISNINDKRVSGSFDKIEVSDNETSFILGPGNFENLPIEKIRI